MSIEIGVSVHDLETLVELKNESHFSSIKSLAICDVTLDWLGTSRGTPDGKAIAWLPDKLVSLSLSGCRIGHLVLSRRLRHLSIDRTRIEELDPEENRQGQVYIRKLVLTRFTLPEVGLPSSLTELTIERCRIYDLPSLSQVKLHRLKLRKLTFNQKEDSLRYFSEDNRFVQSPLIYLVLPFDLKHLDLGDNELTRLPILPDGLEELVADHNMLQNIQVTGKMNILQLNDNLIQHVPSWKPSGLRFVDLRRNPLVSLPIAWRDITRLYDRVVVPSEPGSSCQT